MTIYFKQARRHRKRQEMARESRRRHVNLQLKFLATKAKIQGQPPLAVVMNDCIDFDALQELRDHMAMHEAGLIPWVVMPQRTKEIS